MSGAQRRTSSRRAGLPWTGEYVESAADPSVAGANAAAQGAPAVEVRATTRRGASKDSGGARNVPADVEVTAR